MQAQLVQAARRDLEKGLEGARPGTEGSQCRGRATAYGGLQGGRPGSGRIGELAKPEAGGMNSGHKQTTGPSQGRYRASRPSPGRTPGFWVSCSGFSGFPLDQLSAAQEQRPRSLRGHGQETGTSFERNAEIPLRSLIGVWWGPRLRSRAAGKGQGTGTGKERQG